MREQQENQRIDSMQRIPVSNEAGEANVEDHSHAQLWFAIAGAIILAVSVFLNLQKLGGYIEHIIAGIALLVAGIPVAYHGIRELKENPFSPDILMIIAGVGAALIGSYEEGAAVLILYNFAEATEDYTVDRVRGIAGRIASLLPKRALVKKDGEYVEVPVEQLQVGDVISVKPGWRIPVDGKIVVGSSNLDQSAITGESMPVRKNPGDIILSGSVNIDSSIELLVEKPFKDSMISRITHLVTESKERKAKIERFIDRFSRYYTPSMIVLAAVIALTPPLAFGQPLNVWVYRSLIVLVIACPSALVISTPITMLIGLTRAMWSSILVKGGRYLEEISKVKVVAFDKTGTLTEGKLEVVKIKALNGFSEDKVLHFAALAEMGSSHPIASAIVRAGTQRAGRTELPPIQLREVAGRGVIATVQDGHQVIVGRSSFILENAPKRSGGPVQQERNEMLSQPKEEELYEQWQPSIGSSVDVALDGKLIGRIIVADRARGDAKDAVDSLHKKGIKVVMLTGDNEAIAKKIADEIGIDEYYSGLLPEDKVNITDSLREKYGRVMMVGDGINDAPVLAASSVGVAMGTAGNDVAIEAADVALMGSNINKVPYLLRLGKKVTSRVKFNIAMVLALKFAMISLGAAGLIPLWVGVVGDDGVTLIVIAITLPILRIKD